MTQPINPKMKALMDEMLAWVAFQNAVQAAIDSINNLLPSVNSIPMTASTVDLATRRGGNIAITKNLIQDTRPRLIQLRTEAECVVLNVKSRIENLD